MVFAQWFFLTYGKKLHNCVGFLLCLLFSLRGSENRIFISNKFDDKMNSDNLKFILNNVKGIQKSEKRIKIFEYLKNSISPNGFIFLQETHSSVDDEKRWCDELNGNLYFSHRKTNLGGVAIGHVGSKSFVLANQTADKNGRRLLIEALVDDVKFVLINIYNCNNESQQPLTLTELYKILQNIEDIGNKNIIIGGDFNFHFNSK